jgi:hypothetical protein
MLHVISPPAALQLEGSKARRQPERAPLIRRELEVAMMDFNAYPSPHRV